MGDYLFRIHKSYRWVVAVCDKNVFGRNLKEGPRILDASGDFFNGEEVDEEQLREVLIDCRKEDATFNIVGEKSVKLALDLGLISEEGVMEIEGVPFALVLV